MTSPAERRRARKPPPVPWAYLLAITAGSMLTQGYVVGLINHGLQVPLMRQWAGEEAFKDDVFLQAIAHTYTTVFYPALGMMARAVPLQVLLFVVFAALRLLNVWLAWRLSTQLWRDARAALWTAALMSVQTLTFAEDIVSDIYLTHGAAAQAFTLGTLVLLAQGRYVAAMALTGLHFNVHGMHAIHVIIAGTLGATGLALHARAMKERVIAGLACTLLAAPTIAWMKLSGALGGPPPPPSYVQGIKDWFPTHFWPSTWGVVDWCMLLFPLTACWPLYKLAGHSRDGGVVARVGAWALGIGVAGGIAVELLPLPTLVRFHPMRMSWILALCGIPFIARASVRMMRAVNRRDLDGARLHVALGAALLLGFGVAVLYRSAYLLTLSPALWAAVTWRRRPGLRLPLGLLLAVGAALIPWLHAWSGAREMPLTEAGATPRNFMLVEGLVAAFAAAGVLSAMLANARGPHRGFMRRALFQSAILVAAAHLGTRGIAMAHTQRAGGLAQWRDVQQWAARERPAGETVLVPLNQIGFRVFSRQVPAVDFQEGDAIFHDPIYVDRFLDKLRLYGWQPAPIVGFSHYTRLDPLDRDLTLERAREIGTQLGARIAVRRTRHPSWDAPELFRNRDYVVYRLADGGG